MLNILAAIYAGPLLGALGALAGVAAIAGYRIWRYRRRHVGRKRVEVWAPY
jgi:hypothetical protein